MGNKGIYTFGTICIFSIMSYETTNYNMTFATFYIVLTSDSLQMRNHNVILIPIWDVGIAEAITMTMDKSKVE